MIEQLRSSVWGIALQLVVGLSFLYLGVRVWPTGEPVPEQKQPQPQNMVEPKPARSLEFRLAYESERDYWSVTPLGGKTRRLTDVVPRPEQEPRPGFLSPDEIGKVLLGVLKRDATSLSDQDLASLVDLTLDGQPLFRPEDLRRFGNIPQKTAEVGDKPVYSKPQPLPVLPELYDPTTTVFDQAMKTWAQQMASFVKAAPAGGNANINFEGQRGGPVRFEITERARRRVVATDFGREHRDAALFMQYLAVKNGVSLTVDGGFGKKSRESWLGIIRKLPAWSGHEQNFEAFLIDYFSSEIPALLNPNSKQFRQNMMAWKARIAPALADVLPSGGTVRFAYVFEYRESARRLTFSSGARARLLADDFGSKREDRFIYLQYLANRFGDDLTIDGQMGPRSRNALAGVLLNRFRRNKSLDNSFRNLLR